MEKKIFKNQKHHEIKRLTHSNYIHNKKYILKLVIFKLSKLKQ